MKNFLGKVRDQINFRRFGEIIQTGSFKTPLEELITEAEVLNRFFTPLIQQVQEPRPLAEKLLVEYRLNSASRERLDDIVIRVEKCKKILDEVCAEYGLDEQNQVVKVRELLDYLSTPQNHLKEYYVKAHSTIKRHTFALVLYVPRTCFVVDEPAYTSRHFHYNLEKGMIYFKNPQEGLSQYVPDSSKFKRLQLESLSVRINQEYAYVRTALHHELRHVAESFIQCQYPSELPAHLYTLSFNEPAAGIDRGINHEIQALKKEMGDLVSCFGFPQYGYRLKFSKNIPPVPELFWIQEKIKRKEQFNVKEEVLLREYGRRFDLIKMLTENKDQIHDDLEQLHKQGLSYETLSFVISLTPMERWPEQLRETNQYISNGRILIAG